MQNSEDQKVQKFLDELLIVNPEKFKIVQKLRQKVHKIYPKTNERIMYGGIMFSLVEDFGGIFVSKNHVSFEFGNGFKMNDPEKKLEGTGKFRRHLKFSKLSDVEDKNVDFFVKQAA